MLIVAYLINLTGIERLAAVTGGEIASTFDKPELVRLGECALIDEIMVGEDKLIRFSGCKSGTACTIVLRGASSHLLGTYCVFACWGIAEGGLDAWDGSVLTHFAARCRRIQALHDRWVGFAWCLLSPWPAITLFMLCCAEEAERSLHDALCVLTETVKETRVVCGGGCMEMLMAAAIDRYTTLFPT
jgi:hypothetical protein